MDPVFRVEKIILGEARKFAWFCFLGSPSDGSQRKSKIYLALVGLRGENQRKSAKFTIFIFLV